MTPAAIESALRNPSRKSLVRPLKGREPADRFTVCECQERRSNGKPESGHGSGARRDGGFGGTMPGRPDLRDNFVGRMRAALDWFSHLPTLSRRSILIKGLLAAAVAFVICMGVVWGAEKVIGNSLSCRIWAQCPHGAVPGIHPAGYGGPGARRPLPGRGRKTCTVPKNKPPGRG